MGKKQIKAQEKHSTGSPLEVFISGLPYEATEDDIRGFFDFASDPTIKLPKYQDTGRCLGYGHVVFQTQEELKQALAKDHQNIGSRYINVQRAKGPKQVKGDTETKTVPIGCKVLFLKNLPYNINKEQIRQEFESCGAIKEVRMVKNWQTKQFKGFAYVDFKESNSVKKAIKKYDGKDFKGRKLFVDAVVDDKKKGYKEFENQEKIKKEKVEEIEAEEVQEDDDEISDD